MAIANVLRVEIIDDDSIFIIAAAESNTPTAPPLSTLYRITSREGRRLGVCHHLPQILK